MKEEIKKNIEALKARYPKPRAALLPALWRVQKDEGFISDEAAKEVSDILQLPESEVYSAITFYNMFERRKLGVYHICLCTNICCWLRGSSDIFNYLRAKLGIDALETTKDGLFTLSTVQCLGACEGAPVMMINDEYYNNLNFKRIDEILNELRCRS